jgi:hypothetical protein
VTIVTDVQCSAFFVLFQKKCDDDQCVNFSANRPARKLRALSYGDLAADYHTPYNWIPVLTKVRSTQVTESASSRGCHSKQCHSTLGLGQTDGRTVV